MNVFIFVQTATRLLLPFGVSLRANNFNFGIDEEAIVLASDTNYCGASGFTGRE
jgi:hypothetical protein